MDFQTIRTDKNVPSWKCFYFLLHFSLFPGDFWNITYGILFIYQQYFRPTVWKENVLDNNYEQVLGLALRSTVTTNNLAQPHSPFRPPPEVVAALHHAHH